MALWKSTIYKDAYGDTHKCATTNVTSGEQWGNRLLAIFDDDCAGFAPCDSLLNTVIRERDMDAEEAFFWLNKHWGEEFIKDFEETYKADALKLWYNKLG